MCVCVRVVLYKCWPGNAHERPRNLARLESSLDLSSPRNDVWDLILCRRKLALHSMLKSSPLPDMQDLTMSLSLSPSFFVLNLSLSLSLSLSYLYIYICIIYIYIYIYFIIYIYMRLI